jgi:predicted nuclease of predicted toxin-antitoxin system
MRFLLDANIPRSAIAAVSRLGHQVEFARDIGLSAAPDTQVSQHARKTGAALVTRDLDFSDVRNYPPDLSSRLAIVDENRVRFRPPLD